MRWCFSVGCVLVGLLGNAIAVPKADSVVVLYNTAVPESRQLAESYRDARGIPEDHLVGLEMPVEEEISREQYDGTIAGPLREVFDDRGWWLRKQDAKGHTMPVVNDIHVLVSMRGVPLKIKKFESDEPPPAAAGDQAHLLAGRNEASVDSELAMIGVEGLGLTGPFNNPYFRSVKPIDEAELPYLILTSRIDAATVATCQRMIEDAVAAEKTGLWGMSYVDIANKFPMGDKWLEDVVKQNLELGIPTVVDRFSPTLPSHYPMRDAAMYFGWYIRNVDGPFLNPSFRFRKGAVAMHLHSFSCEQMRNPERNWCAALLECGAAATVGNVYEPYLGSTHHFNLLHERLLDGFSWVEACWMAMPAVSWQGVVFGDPLYQPFKHLKGTGEVLDTDREYRALMAAKQQWPHDEAERRVQLKNAAVRMNSGILFEALALEFIEEKQDDRAGSLLVQARDLYKHDSDLLRLDLHLAAIERDGGRKQQAVNILREAEQKFAVIPEVLAVKGLLDILDPPPPPPASPDGKTSGESKAK